MLAMYVRAESYTATLGMFFRTFNGNSFVRSVALTEVCTLLSVVLFNA